MSSPPISERAVIDYAVQRTELDRRNKLSSFASSLRAALKNVCKSERLKSFVSTSSSFSKVDKRKPKVRPLSSRREASTYDSNPAANKEELLDMIQHGVEKIVNSSER